jgi:hypothetical protein
MTDRISGVIVTLEDDMRIDDAESLLNAIRMLRGVADVSANVTDFNHHMAKTQAKTELVGKIYAAIREY